MNTESTPVAPRAVDRGEIGTVKGTRNFGGNGNVMNFDCGDDSRSTLTKLIKSHTLSGCYLLYTNELIKLMRGGLKIFLDSIWSVNEHLLCVDIVPSTQDTEATDDKGRAEGRVKLKQY